MPQFAFIVGYYDDEDNQVITWSNYQRENRKLSLVSVPNPYLTDPKGDTSNTASIFESAGVHIITGIHAISNDIQKLGRHLDEHGLGGSIPGTPGIWFR